MRARPLVDLLWLPVNLLQVSSSAIWSAFWISVALLVATVTRRREPALWMARRVWAPGMIAIGLSRLRVVGRERLDLRRSYFFAANHQSWLDIPVLFAAVPAPLHFLAKQELARIPFLGWYIAAMGMVFVDRSDRRKAIASVDRASRLLAAGDSLVSFPEGTRSAPGELGRFKSGGFAAVVDASGPGVEVVPVGIVGAGRILPRGGFKIRPGTVEVRIGEPIPAAGLGLHDRAQLARRTEAAVATLLGLPARPERPEPAGVASAPPATAPPAGPV